MKRVIIPRVSLFIACMLGALLLTACGTAKTDTMPATDNPVPVATANPTASSAPAPAPGPVAASPSQRRQDVDVSVFQDELAPYGRWINDDQYGDVWMPSNVEAGWRPYSHGYWSDTDEGWAWVSDEQFGWATYHYGRWHYNNEYGWEWVPGSVWGPAWVAWRDAPGYVGWAPLPPQCIWRDGYGLEAFDYDRGIDSSWYNFVDEGRFTDRRLNLIIEVPARNVTFFGDSRNITNYSYENNRVINHGEDVAHVEEATGRRIAINKIVDTNTASQSRGQNRAGTVTMYRPQVPNRASAATTARVNPVQEQPQARDQRQQLEQRNLQQQKTLETTRLQQQQAATLRRTKQTPQNQPQGQVQPGRIVQPQRQAQAARVQDVKKQQAVETQAHNARWQQEQQTMQNRHVAEQKGKLPPPPQRQASPQPVAPPQRSAPQKQAPPPAQPKRHG